MQVWEGLGCKVRQDDARCPRRRFRRREPPAAPDRLCAHQRITSQDHGKDFLSLAGPGFRDFTRIAASEPKMWRDILLANRQELLAQSKLFQRALQAMEQMIDRRQCARPWKT